MNKKLKICALMPTSVRHSGRMANNRTNIKNYFGLNIIINEISKNLGINVPIVNWESVNKYDVVLFSALSIEDYYSLVFTVERKLKGIQKGVWIAGGPSVSNINPFIKYFDYTVIGRGEDIIKPLLTAISYGFPFVHQSVVDRNTYQQEKQYFVNYAKKLYPDAIGKVEETMYGCKYNCSYCRYRTATLPPTKRDFDKGTTMPGNEETFWDLDIKNGNFHTTSLDGMTQAQRFAVLKPIKAEQVIKGFIKWSEQTKKINLKMYQIIGYPYNPEVDFSEMKYIFSEVAKAVKTTDIFVTLHYTPFGADPQTAMQWEAVNIFSNYRNIIESKRANESYLVESENVRVMHQRTTMHPFTLLRRMIFQRAELSDMDIIEYVGSNPKQNNRHIYNDEKFSMTMDKFDISKFVKEYNIGDWLPTQNINTWKPLEQMAKEGARTRMKLKEARTIII